ncbi:hypothetical protein ACQP00_34035 [Dactylosporangium sp. CS-047395]|uniref:hypothetical protein n=1 Tax=Dactylosporangium sp. CS-047395 TaxID=3239936 RepID=UPI003D93DD9B
MALRSQDRAEVVGRAAQRLDGVVRDRARRRRRGQQLGQHAERGGHGVGDRVGPPAALPGHGVLDPGQAGRLQPLDPGVAGRGPVGRPVQVGPVLDVEAGERLQRLLPLDEDRGDVREQMRAAAVGVEVPHDEQRIPGNAEHAHGAQQLVGAGQIVHSGTIDRDVRRRL